MKAAWKSAVVLLACAVVAMIAGAWMTWTARSQARLPQEMLAARGALIELGDQQGLIAGRQALADVRERLELERTARASNAAVFSRQVEAAFAELDLSITSSSDWQAVPEISGDHAAGFERTFEGSGAFGALLDAVHTIESWPDRAGIRALTVWPEATGTVAFTLKIATIRHARVEPHDPHEEHEES